MQDVLEILFQQKLLVLGLVPENDPRESPVFAVLRKEAPDHRLVNQNPIFEKPRALSN
jgi:hypothetical protein